MDPTDFPPLDQQNKRQQSGTSTTFWISESQNSSSANECPMTTTRKSYADVAAHETRLSETNHTPSEHAKAIPTSNVSKCCAPTYTGLPTPAESIETENPPKNNLTMPKVLNQSGNIVTKSSTSPANTIISKPPLSISGPQMENNGTKRNLDVTETLQPANNDKHVFPPLDSSASQPSSDSIHRTSQSYAETIGQDLDHTPPSTQSHVDQQPKFYENDVMKEQTRGNKREPKQMDHFKLTKDATHEMDMIPQQQANVDKGKSKIERQQAQGGNTTGLVHRLCIEKFTIFNTVSSLHSSGYSWLASLAAAVLLHLRYSPATSPYRFPFIYRSLIDVLTLPIYTKRLLQLILLSFPLLRQPRQNLEQDLTTYQYTEGTACGLRLHDGFRIVKQHEKEAQLQWWQIKLWLSHRLQWLASYMALQDPSSRLVLSSTLLSLKNKDNQA